MHRLFLLFPFLGSMLLAAETNSGRLQVSLDGDWLFHRDGAPADQWKAVQVPSSFQSHEGTDWHGCSGSR
jgi:hypothetical protein